MNKNNSEIKITVREINNVSYITFTFYKEKDAVLILSFIEDALNRIEPNAWQIIRTRNKKNYVVRAKIRYPKSEVIKYIDPERIKYIKKYLKKL